MIDANLYPALVKAYDIQRVPLTVIDRKRFVPGGKTMAELTSLLARYK
jgi:predicted DsbA family dithiol-disulfide isomerase